MQEANQPMQGMTIQVGEIKCALPITAIRQSIKADCSQLVKDPNGNEMLKTAEAVYNLVRLYEFFDINTAVTRMEDGIIIVLENGDKQLCVLADALIGETEISIYPLPAYLPVVAGISGCTLIDDNEIFLVIDVSAFFGETMRESAVQTVCERTACVSGDESLSTLQNKYFIFEVDNEEYGIEVANIKEIIGFRKILSLPCVPDYIEGLISLRGEIIPVINVRKRFHKASRQHDISTCIIVVHYLEYNVGLIVDCVKEVAFIAENNISKPPSAKRDYHNQFVNNLGRTGDTVRQLIDLDSLLSHAR